MKLRAVIFDLYWTLLYEEDIGLNERATELARQAGADPKTWWRAWRNTLEASWRGEFTLLGRVKYALAKAGAVTCDGEIVEKLFGVMGARSAPRLYEDARESLTQVRSLGYKMGLISNIASYRTIWLRELELTPFFDVMALSCELGKMKPQHEMYQWIVDELALQPQECVLVDDVPSYLQAAKQLGLVTVRINRFDSDDVYHEYYDDLSCEPELQIENLGQLLEWLKSQMRE